mgnify:CR=1
AGDVGALGRGGAPPVRPTRCSSLQHTRFNTRTFHVPFKPLILASTSELMLPGQLAPRQTQESGSSSLGSYTANLVKSGAPTTSL